MMSTSLLLNAHYFY